ncbi:hypothetical protein GCM10011521_00490 [Arenimonas soli]|uniref:DUF4124 domain-containing protein n=1 Tax=Arenimonas soli TaxID=2269504 RepID=A0ABQ1HAX0_9GAMM|nr:DUF4124 domain-containing protein [Arenimonas soli]GGA66305.1 hypothetical protein GCM10011521_00490 [Arenimonas soli]
MRRFALALCCLAAAAPAAAESLFKCTDAQGAVSILSEPCPAGSTQVWKRDATPEPGPSVEELAARAALAEAEARRAAEEARLAEAARLAEEQRLQAEAQARAEEAAGSPRRKSECTQAHEFSESVLEKQWLRLTEAQRAELRAWVVAQCANVYDS